MSLGQKIPYCRNDNSPQIEGRFDATPVKTSAGVSGVGIDKLVLKFMWKCEGSRRIKTSLKEEDKVRGLTPLTSQDGVRLAQRQTNRQVGQNIVVLFLTKLQRQFGGERTVSDNRWCRNN